MATVVIQVFDSEAGTTSQYSFNASPVRIGRNPLNDLTLPFGFVSGWHAVVRFDGREATFHDLGSTNGTLFNGRRVQPGESVPIEPLVSVTIGKLELQIRALAEESHRRPPTPNDWSAPRPPTGDFPVPPPPIPAQPGFPRGSLHTPSGLSGPHGPSGLSGPPSPSGLSGPHGPPGLSVGPSLGGGPAHAPTYQVPSQAAPPNHTGGSSPPPGAHPQGMHAQAGPTHGHGMPGQASQPGPAPRGQPDPIGLSARLRGDASPPAVGSHAVSGSTAHVEMSDVHQLVHRLRPLHQVFRQGWTQLQADIAKSLEVVQPALRPFAVSILMREFPELAREPEFKALAAKLGAAFELPAAAASTGSGGDLAAIRGLARSLCPEDDPPTNEQEARGFLSCVEDVLRASAKAFIELQNGQEQFGKEVGVRTIKEFTALHAAGTPEKILSYLLDWRHGGPRRTQELVGAYADLMIHQVALVNGLMEGVRGLLARLAPEEVERGVTAGWPTRAAALWKRYTERHAEIAGEDKSIMAVVFGQEFARAYAEVGGDGGRRRG